MIYETVFSNRKTLALQVMRDGSVVVRAPHHTSKKRIAEFVEAHRAWIERSVERQKNAPTLTDDKEELAALKRKAGSILPEKVRKYAALMGVCPARVSFGRAKTRFGCCSSKKSIVFSVYLMLYPEEAIDYVVVHELAHLRYMNHGKQFYRLIAGVLPDYKERIKLLKYYQRKGEDHENR